MFYLKTATPTHQTHSIPPISTTYNERNFHKPSEDWKYAGIEVRMRDECVLAEKNHTNFATATTPFYGWFHLISLSSSLSSSFHLRRWRFVNLVNLTGVVWLPNFWLPSLRLSSSLKLENSHGTFSQFQSILTPYCNNNNRVKMKTQINNRSERERRENLVLHIWKYELSGVGLRSKYKSVYTFTTYKW